MGILDKLFSGNILYYPGCLTKFVDKDLLESYRDIWQRGGLNAIELGDREVCCGSPVYNAGFDKDFGDLAQKNLETFKSHGISRIVTSCPGCYKVFSKLYPEVLGEKWNLPTRHATQVIWELLESGKLKPRKRAKDGLRVTYHDPCHLGRQMGVYDEPRKILIKLGFELVEMDLNMEDSFCCGAGGGVGNLEKNFSKRVGEFRIDQAKEKKADILVSACGLCKMQFEKVKDGIEVKDIGELVADSIG